MPVYSPFFVFLQSYFKTTEDKSVRLYLQSFVSTLITRSMSVNHATVNE